ncbi:M61 family metallopeptidase, partial [Burkholderia sp. Ac-20379]|nr:hypothetical protein [Burkholderia sp. Ac-20379]
MKVHYDITLDPAAHALEVTLSIEAPGPGELVLTTPGRTPGAYDTPPLVRDLYGVCAARTQT